MHARLQNGLTALHEAAGSGHSECVTKLLAAGANKEAVDKVSGVVCCDSALLSPTLVYMLLRQQCQALLVTIVLNEDDVPNFQHIRIILVDNTCCIATSNTIEVDLGTRTTRTSIAHL